MKKTLLCNCCKAALIHWGCLNGNRQFSIIIQYDGSIVRSSQFSCSLLTCRLILTMIPHSICRLYERKIEHSFVVCVLEIYRLPAMKFSCIFLIIFAICLEERYANAGLVCRGSPCSTTAECNLLEGYHSTTDGCVSSMVGAKRNIL